MQCFIKLGSSNGFDDGDRRNFLVTLRVVRSVEPRGLVMRNMPAGLDRLSDKELLRMRFCDLPIRLRGTPVEQLARQVFSELVARHIRVRPSIWLSEEWFNPDSTVGFAIPFYLAHPRLIRLERRLMLEAEGASEGEALRIIRHETGHAIDEAFQFYRHPEYTALFGSPQRPYPSSYAVKPHSRRYVVHLNAWYAQAHPVEDFAETFATWLRPKRQWRRQYRDWPAIEKLEAVDAWLKEWRDKPPMIANRRPQGELIGNERTLSDHYEEKRAFYGVHASAKFDSELQRIFVRPDITGRMSGRLPPATSILRTIRSPVRKELARPLGVPAYTVDQVLRQLIQRARALGLKHARPTARTIDEVVKLVSRATTDALRNAPRLPL
jgi:putative zinc-binding metallo-peptidase